jgi:hypothetical protein
MLAQANPAFANGFDANSITPVFESGAGLPEGSHNVTIFKCEIEETKNGGAKISFGFENDEGKAWHNLNVAFADMGDAGNQQSLKISQGQLSAICHCTGVFNVVDLTQLIGKSLRVTLKKSKENHEGKTFMNISKFERVDSPGVSGAPVVGQQQQPAQTASPFGNAAAQQPAVTPFGQAAQQQPAVTQAAPAEQANPSKPSWMK